MTFVKETNKSEELSNNNNNHNPNKVVIYNSQTLCNGDKSMSTRLSVWISK